jgi:3-hydroxyacyl-CoA dehydrogenase/enoyl-CoA hydratase/3-hydroxybutyryl-CoA epimerase
MSGMIHRLGDDGVLDLIFDTPGERVNLLSEVLLRELAKLLDQARVSEDVTGVVFKSAKPGMFIAGMDVEQIAAVTDAHEAAEAARFGQAVFQRIADLGKPSVCAIGGPCMGGGTELALACGFRVAADDSSVKIGLPEVQIGIIPGFGGTQRLPRLVGLPAALDLILTGRAVDGNRARKLGLVDMVVPGAYLEREARGLIERAIKEGTAQVTQKIRRKRPLSVKLLEKVSPLRRFALEKARKKTASRVDPTAYPAPFRAIEAIEAALTEELPQGLDIEARIVGELIPTPTSKNLIWLFKSRTALTGRDTGAKSLPRKVNKVAVIGAGIMGGGIAQLAADRKIPVRLKDIRYEALLTALSTAQGIWDFKLKRRKISRAEVDRRMAFIAPTLDDSGLARVDVAIEAVVENLGVKQAVLGDIEQSLDPQAIFATNTSSLPIREIASKAMHPERVVGMHFFNPVHRMPLVEVIAGRESSPEAVATVRALAIRLGKVPVVVSDGPGFLVNRILSMYLNEAAHLLQEGVRIEFADRAMTAFGMPMGPFALLDQIGLDTARHVGQVLQEAFGARVGATDTVMGRLVSEERLGKKTGRGFYTYRGGKAVAPDPEIYRLLDDPAPRELPPELLQERMVYAMVNEAALCLAERVAANPRDLDMAMVMGTGFPPFRGGLLRHVDSIGVPIVVDRLTRMADAQGDRFRPAELLQQMVREQRRFYPGR